MPVPRWFALHGETPGIGLTFPPRAVTACPAARMFFYDLSYHEGMSDWDTGGALPPPPEGGGFRASN